MEILSHEVDKTIDRLIHNQELHATRLEKVTEKLERLETFHEREEGRRQLIVSLISNKTLIWGILLFLALIVSNDAIPVLKNLIGT